MKKILILLITLILNCSMYAQFISKNEALNVSLNFYNALIASKSKCTEEFEIKYNNQTVYYIFNFNNSGYVITSACKSLYPVFAYSTNSSYNINIEHSPEFLAVMEQYSKVVEYYNKHNIVNVENIQKWDSIYDNKLPKGIFPDSTEFLITSIWGQGCNNQGECLPGYNAYAKPTDDGSFGGNCSTGCGATAIGQVMKYWNFGLKDGYNYWDWSLMPDSLMGPGREQDEVARLLGQIGKDVWMIYCFRDNESFNPPLKMEVALNSYGYGDAELFRRETLSHIFWKKRIKDNLDESHPVIYMGLSDGIDSDTTDEQFGSHAFILDGYNFEEHFHVNWGWSGTDNGWFYINDLKPDTLYNYNNWFERVILNIYPTEVSNACTDFYGIDCDDLLENRLNINAPIANIIYSSDNEECQVINSGDNVRYKAYSQIRLRQGFKVESGAKFRATLIECPESKQTIANTKSELQSDDLEQNFHTLEIFPNPATNSITINFAVSENAETIIKIYNIFGQLQATVLSEIKKTGEYSVQYNISDLANGMYICTLQNGSINESKKIIKQSE